MQVDTQSHLLSHAFHRALQRGSIATTLRIQDPLLLSQVRDRHGRGGNGGLSALDDQHVQRRDEAPARAGRRRAASRDHDGSGIQIATGHLQLQPAAPFGATPEIEPRKRRFQAHRDVEQRHVRHHLRQPQPKRSSGLAIVLRDAHQPVEVAQKRRRRLVDAPTDCRGGRRPAGAVQQGGTQHLFELLYASRDGRLRQRQRVGGLGQGRPVDDGRERLQFFQHGYLRSDRYARNILRPHAMHENYALERFWGRS